VLPGLPVTPLGLAQLGKGSPSDSEHGCRQGSGSQRGCRAGDKGVPMLAGARLELPPPVGLGGVSWDRGWGSEVGSGGVQVSLCPRRVLTCAHEYVVRSWYSRVTAWMCPRPPSSPPVAHGHVSPRAPGPPAPPPRPTWRTELRSCRGLGSAGAHL